MKIKHYLFLLIVFLVGFQATSQIAANYEVGTWKDFKTAAVSYTFDDNLPGQQSTALPLFDKYGYKITFFTVTTGAAGANPNWANIKKASDNGHDISSHSVNHPQNLATAANEENEYSNSKNTIIQNVPSTKCQTIAYPNCNIGTISLMQKYFIAGRVCDGQIISKTPSDFWRLGSIITGNTGSVNTESAWNGKVTSAKNSGGWCVFLTHAIDNESGYSPTSSSELSKHLTFMNTNKADYWVGTFTNVVKYIKERNALKLVETTVSADSLQVTPTDNLDNATYDAALTIRRVLPSNWTTARVRDVSGKLITSSIVTVNSKKYVMFDATPDKGTISIANPNRIATGFDNQAEQNELALKVFPNPFNSELTVNVSGLFEYSIQNMTGEIFYSGVGQSKIELGNELAKGIYLLKISQLGVNSKVIKIVKN